MKNLNSALLFSYIFFHIGMAASMVGKVSECSTEPTKWHFPLFIGAFLALPAVLGYMIKNENHE